MRSHWEDEVLESSSRDHVDAFIARHLLTIVVAVMVLLVGLSVANVSNQISARLQAAIALHP